MKNFKPKRSVFALAPVAAGCALLLVSTTTVYAQEQKQENLGVVTVTGIRKGIEDAISVKKNSDSIVEAVSAEDIGKLPDVSIGESIARLPGLAAQRVAGRAQVISVRGLSPDFATTLLNGREQVSTGDNRSVEFDQYPSELLSGVTVYKTPDAGLIGQGLSGTIDMQTVRPLSFPGRTVTLSARAENNSLGSIANTKATGNRFSFSYIDQFADRTLGVALGFAHLDSPVLENQLGLYDPWGVNGRSGVPANTVSTNGAKSLARSGSNKRDGLMAVVEWKPSKEWTSVLDLFTSKFKKEDTANQIEVNLGDYNGGNSPGLNYTQANVNGNGVLTSGVATGLYPLVRGLYASREDTINSLGWNNSFKMNGWTLNADLSTSKTKKDEVLLETNTQLQKVNGVAPLDSATFNWAASGFPTLKFNNTYSDPTKLFVDNTIYGPGYGKTPKVEDTLNSFKLTASLPAPAMVSGLFSGLNIGLNYANRTKEKHQPEGGINLAGPASAISSDLQYSPVDLGFSGTGMIPAWNVPGAVAKYQTFAPSEIATDNNSSYLAQKSWKVDEKITTSYLKGNIDSHLGSVDLRGNVGVQIQNTDQSSSAQYWDQGTQTSKPTTDGKTYTDVLPSMNLVFSLADDQTVRVGAAQQVARPRVDQMRSAIDFGIDITKLKPGGSGGNAQLDPWRADAFDISYEKYFGKKAYFAAAAFYKNLKSYIYEQTTTDYDFSRFSPKTAMPIPANTNLGSYTAPFNGSGGTLKGIELSMSLPLSLISKEMDGFGVIASASSTDSQITIQDPSSNIGADIPLPGLSKMVSNFTVYYEKGGFNTRISQRKRSDFVGEITTFNATRSLRYVVGETIVDLQAGYNFADGPMKGLGLVIQVNNLNDAAYQTYSQSGDRPLEYIKYGRTVLFGANYKF